MTKDKNTTWKSEGPISSPCHPHPTSAPLSRPLVTFRPKQNRDLLCLQTTSDLRPSGKRPRPARESPWDQPLSHRHALP